MKARFHFKKWSLYIRQSLNKQGKIKSHIAQIPLTQRYVEKTVLSFSQIVSACNLNSSNSDFCVRYART